MASHVHTVQKLALSLAFACLAEVTLAAEYPYLYRSAYFLGRGDTGIAIADNEEAIFYNPAGLSPGKGIYKKAIVTAPMVEISRSTRDVIKQIGLQKSDPISTFRKQVGSPQHIGFNYFTGLILRQAALGVFAHSSSTAMIYKNYEKGAFEAVSAQSVSDAGLTFSLAQSLFNKNLHFGMTTKYFKRTQAALEANATEADALEGASSDSLTMLGTASGIDLGMTYRSEGRAPWSIGMTLQDVGNTAFTPDKPTTVVKALRPLKDIKQTLNLGLAIEPGTQHSKVRLLADFRDALNQNKQSIYKRIHLGSELSISNFIGFTAGLNQGYGTFGIYLDARFLRMDLGGYTEEVGDEIGTRGDQRYYLKFAISL